MADAQLNQETLFTMRLTRGELRAIKANANSRGLSMSGWLRELLRRELVDLIR